MLIRLKQMPPVAVTRYDGTNIDQITSLCHGWPYRLIDGERNGAKVVLIALLSKYPPQRELLVIGPGDVIAPNADREKTPFVIRAEDVESGYDVLPILEPPAPAFRARLTKNSFGHQIETHMAPGAPFNCTVVPDPAFEAQAVFVLLVKWFDGPKGENWKALVSFRSGSVSYSGFVQCPGGKVDPGETVLHAAARELQEETGLVATDADRFLQVASQAQHGRRGWTECLCYVYRWPDNAPCEPVHTEPDKMSRWEWVPVVELMNKHAQGVIKLVPGLHLAIIGSRLCEDRA